MMNRASRSITTVFRNRLQSYKATQPSAFAFPVRLCANKVSPATHIHDAVRDFINVRRSELEEYEAVDQADKEETRKLIDQLLGAKVDEDTTWASLGFDGLDEVEVVLAIEQALGITLPDDEFHTIRSVADAVKVFSKYTAQKG